jgi:hypothetical protein
MSDRYANMIDMATNVGLNILAAPIIFFLGFIVFRGFAYLHDELPLAEIWGLKGSWEIRKRKHEALVAVTQLDYVSPEGPLTGMGELRAYALISESLIQAYRNLMGIMHIELRHSGDFSGDLGCNNIISIGGPKYNEVTRDFRERFSDVLPLYFEIEDTKQYVVDRNEKKRYESNTQQGNNLLDYGVITKLSNPYHPGKCEESVVFLVEGTYTYGLAAIGRLLTKDYFRSLLKEVKGSESPYWQVLIRAQVKGEWQVYPEIVRLIELPLEKVDRYRRSQTPVT